jgi:hypothetical protein
MSDIDVRDRLERLMTDEPAHRPLAAVVTAGAGSLRRRRLTSAMAAAAIVAVVGVAASLAFPGGSGQAVHDPSGVADQPSTVPSTPPAPSPTTEPGMGQTLDPDARASYSYAIYPNCSGAQECNRYRFESHAIRDAVVAAVEFRLTDGSSKRVDAHKGEYHVVMTGTLPDGATFQSNGSAVDAQGGDVDLFAGLTLFAADGSVLATATSTRSKQLDPYLEICDLIDDPTCEP